MVVYFEVNGRSTFYNIKLLIKFIRIKTFLKKGPFNF